MNHLTKSSRKLAALLSLLSILGLYGCAVALIGVGAAAGVGSFSYFTGKLTKIYESEYHETVRAARHTLEKLKIPITDTIADGLKTEIKAKRPDETPVNIEVVRIDREHTEVSVRTGEVGIWDKRVSEQIHGYINEALSQKFADFEKPSEGLAKEDIQPTIDEVVHPQIIEEDLDDNSSQENVSTESITDLGDQAPGEGSFKSAGMLSDSLLMIFFQQNSNELSKKAIGKLDRIYEILINNPETELTLNGYSDSIGSRSYNEMISEIRAKAVKSHLVGKGVDSAKITALGHGPQKFIATNKTAEGRRMNRRVEIEIINTRTENH
jgi:outer membrane protein OmpA-like peptidoglycan-associated protein